MRAATEGASGDLPCAACRIASKRFSSEVSLRRKPIEPFSTA
jgi:hypothetical protein